MHCTSTLHPAFHSSTLHPAFHSTKPNRHGWRGLGCPAHNGAALAPHNGTAQCGGARAKSGVAPPGHGAGRDRATDTDCPPAAPSHSAVLPRIRADVCIRYPGGLWPGVFGPARAQAHVLLAAGRIRADQCVRRTRHITPPSRCLPAAAMPEHRGVRLHRKRPHPPRAQGVPPAGRRAARRSLEFSRCLLVLS